MLKELAELVRIETDIRTCPNLECRRARSVVFISGDERSVIVYLSCHKRRGGCGTKTENFRITRESWEKFRTGRRGWLELVLDKREVLRNGRLKLAR